MRKKESGLGEVKTSLSNETLQVSVGRTIEDGRCYISISALVLIEHIKEHEMRHFPGCGSQLRSWTTRRLLFEVE
jgi:hypothetical protein